MRRLSLIGSLVLLVAIALRGVTRATTQQSPVTAYTMTQDVRV